MVFPPLTTDDDVGLAGWLELEDTPATTDEEDSLYAIGGAAGLDASSAQPNKNVPTPRTPMNRNFFFMIYQI
jgi:hypothetical protein